MRLFLSHLHVCLVLSYLRLRIRNRRISSIGFRRYFDSFCRLCRGNEPGRKYRFLGLSCKVFLFFGLRSSSSFLNQAERILNKHYLLLISCNHFTQFKVISVKLFIRKQFQYFLDLFYEVQKRLLILSLVRFWILHFHGRRVLGVLRISWRICGNRWNFHWYYQW